MEKKQFNEVDMLFDTILDNYYKRLAQLDALDTVKKEIINKGFPKEFEWFLNLMLDSKYEKDLNVKELRDIIGNIDKFTLLIKNLPKITEINTDLLVNEKSKKKYTIISLYNIDIFEIENENTKNIKSLCSDRNITSLKFITTFDLDSLKSIFSNVLNNDVYKFISYLKIIYPKDSINVNEIEK